MPGMVQMIEGLGERPTHVETVRECKPGSKTCCANRRDKGAPKKGEFQKKCRDAGLRVVVGGHEIEPKGMEGLHMARRHRRHASLAEYGEPFGGMGGFFSDLLDKKDWIDFGVIAGSATVAAVTVPKLVKLADHIPWAPLRSPYAKGIYGIVGGFLIHKFLGRKLPAKYHDAVVAVAAVTAGLGLATIGHQLFDTGSVGAKLKGFHGLGNLFPVSLSNVGPAEDALLAGLQAVEDQALSASMDPQFGAFVNDDEEPQFYPEMEPEQGMFGDAEMEGLGAYENEMDGLDATVMNPDGWSYGEERDLKALSIEF